MKTKTDSHEAIARGTSLPISTKMSCEVCRNIRGKALSKAITHMEAVLKLKRPIEVRRFNRDLGHKPGYGPARYPVKAAKAFLELLNLAKANAENKGLNSEKLVISFAKADFGPQRWHYGRQRRTKMKDTHVEIRVKESEKVEAKDKNKTKGTLRKAAAKPKEKETKQ